MGSTSHNGLYMLRAPRGVYERDYHRGRHGSGRHHCRRKRLFSGTEYQY
jgi:hypothetical protein